MELTILMPCLNEAETIAFCVDQAQKFLLTSKIDGEVLIADNGSHDGSQEIAISHGARVINVPVRGYGAALIAGIEQAKGRYIIMGDADASYDFSSLNSFVEKLRSGAELVMGNRFKGGIKPGAMPFLNKYLGNPVLSFIGRIFYRTPIRDFHCGLRGFNRNSMQKLNLKSPGMEFASEMVIKAALKKIKMEEVPTTLSPDGRSRAPHLRKWRDGWRHLRLLLLCSPRWLFLYPGLILSSLGLFFMLLLAITPLDFKVFSLNIHTELFAGGFLIIGIQSIAFAIFSKIITLKQLKIPLEGTLKKIISAFSLEKGILLGLAITLLGVAGSVLSFALWAKVNFGTLIPIETMRLAIPSVFFLIIGVQLIFYAFFGQLILANITEACNE